MSASHSAASRKREETGLRRDRHGWEAYIKIRGQQFSKRFPPDTPLNAMRLWRAERRAESRNILRGVRLTRTFEQETKPLPKSLHGWCYVYFIQDGEHVKIGRAIDPADRRCTLQTAHGRPLTLIAAIPGHAIIERAIHQRFERLRVGVGTEWFKLDLDLEAFIDKLKAGANPIALLW